MTGLVNKLVGVRKFSEFQFLITLMLVAAILSSFINNIGALAILLPITLNICQKMGWRSSRHLMPLAFACILGGMNTVIGTPPNIIISEYKSTITNSAFGFFDFSYVGLLVTLVSIMFIVFIGKNFIPLRKDADTGSSLINLDGYLFEVLVNEDSICIGKTLSWFKKNATEDTEVLGIVSDAGSISKVNNNFKIKENQILVIKNPPDAVSGLLEKLNLSIPKELHHFTEEDLEEIEVMITPGSRLIGRKYDFFFKSAYENEPPWIWRKGSKYRTRLLEKCLELVMCFTWRKDLEEEGVANKLKYLGLMPLLQRELQTIPSRSRLLKGIIFFLASILLVTFNVMPPQQHFFFVL